MKNLFATASLLIALTATALVAQTSETQTAPVSGATEIGSFIMDLSIMSAPQPDLVYAGDENDRTAVDVHVWLVSGTDGNPDQVILTTNEGSEIMDWAKNDATYHSASEQYVFEKAGANMVWMAYELGYDLNKDLTKVFIDKTTDGTTDRTKALYEIKLNGGNTEVCLLTGSKS